MTDAKPLKLRARDRDDLSVIAACVQDALVPIGDMAYLPEQRRFVLALNRFRWDSAVQPRAEKPGAARNRDAPFAAGSADPQRFERVLSGLRFERVTAVRTRGIDLRQRGRVLELLTLRIEEGALLLIFAGGATIRLEADKIRCYLEDFGQGWTTRVRPRHRLSDEEPTGA
jgi:hypothetical protein